MAHPDIPGNPCQEVKEKRLKPLGIAQEEECVTWSRLVELRELYNSLFYDRLHPCGLAEGVRYGTPPHKEEISPLPTVEGCWRLDIHIEESKPPCTISVDYNRFMITGGTFLDLVDDPDYTYLRNDKDGPFYFKLQDECYVCGKCEPTTSFDAVITLECPDEVNTTYFEDWKLVLYAAAPEACNIQTDFGEKAADFEEFAHLFTPCKTAERVDVNPGCVIEKTYCCEKTIYGYYEVWDHPTDDDLVVLKLTMVRIGEPGDYTGIVTPFIRADRLQEIRDLVTSQAPYFMPNKCEICDPCGPTERLKCYDPDVNIDSKAFSCLGPPFSWGNTSIAMAVQGYDDCEPCADGFGGTICTCPWEELAAVMVFISGNGCIPECSSCPCSCSSSSSSSSSGSSSDSSSGSSDSGSASGGSDSGNPSGGDGSGGSGSGNNPSNGTPSDGSGSGSSSGFMPPP